MEPPDRHLDIKSAGGHRLNHYGWSRVRFRGPAGQKIEGRFEVTDVHRGIFSVAQLVDRSHTVVFASEANGGAFIQRPGGERLPLKRRGGVYELPCEPVVGGVSAGSPAHRTQGWPYP